MNLVKTGYPKWDGLVDLKQAGLPTPEGLFIWPYSSEEKIRKTVEFFTTRCRTELLALRPDGKGGTGATPPGINLKKTDLISIQCKLIEWSTEGYGVTLVETHNRFNYDFCCNVLFDDKGGFIIEFVGPGYDGGDLNKSILTPTMVVKSKTESPVFYYSDLISGNPNTETLDALSFRVDIEARIPTEQERLIRLDYIMKKLLPDMGIKIDKTVEATIAWLKQNTEGKVLERINPRTCVSAEDLYNIIFCSSLYAHALIRQGKSISAQALTAHKYNGKIVFFGTYDSKKWGSHTSSVLQSSSI